MLSLSGILQDLWKWQLDLRLHHEVPALTIPRLVISSLLLLQMLFAADFGLPTGSDFA